MPPKKGQVKAKPASKTTPKTPRTRGAPKTPTTATPSRTSSRSAAKKAAEAIDIMSTSEDEDVKGKAAVSKVDWRSFLQNPMPEDWPGWLTVESDPGVFNQLLRDFGVGGVRVNEVYAIDYPLIQSMLPVHGLILLFKYNEGKEEELDDIEDTPDNLWFANQDIHATNACASYALLNIILNIPEARSSIDIGEHLRSFRNFTIEMTPPNRGLTLAGHDFIRTAHNRYGKRLETAHEDLKMEGNYEEAQKPKKGGRKKGKEKEEVAEGEVYHFIAYVPFEGQVYELDGLRRTPSVVGMIKPDEDWTKIVFPLLEERFNDHMDEGITTNLLAVCDEPLVILRPQAVALTNFLSEISRLVEDSVGRDGHPLQGLSADDNLPDSVKRELESLLQKTDNLQGAVSEFVGFVNGELEKIDRRIAEERSILDEYAVYSARRRHNYMPFLIEYMTILHRKGLIQVTPEEDRGDKAPKGRGGRGAKKAKN